MDIEFIEIPEQPEEAFNSVLKSICKSANQIRDNDTQWVNKIIKHVLNYYTGLTVEQKEYLQGESEDNIKSHMRDYLNKKQDFNIADFLIVNMEPRNLSAQTGFYDLKFESSLWNKYFVIECKCIDHTINSLREYVYCEKKKKDNKPFFDGGIYRFVINKYATNLPFGGMLGFVKKGAMMSIRSNLIKLINGLELESHGFRFGQIKQNDVSQNEFDDYFTTLHERYDVAKQTVCDPVLIYHFLFDFTNVA